MKITLYVDVVSPFGYIAYHTLRHDPVFKNYKDKWINNERLRWARYFNVPIVTDVPDGFPANTLHVMRTICALGHLASTPDQQAPSSPPAAPAAQQHEATVRALDAFFDAYWVRSRDVADKDVVAGVLTRAGWGNDLAAVSELAAGGDAKKALAGNTDRAFADGAFGLPWFACENDRGEREGFWGVDHLGCLLDFLGLERPAGRGGWKAML
ncbi:putative 2-hydroxychromene-2-carboxylate isomerase [Diaporthe ampelina]|uniref:Putative 2-hydroxychromene-2-carboxylate isomerase n=1 Tax=Diaporthe ampelina TaxID=1214573 RepID=A0A0G2HNN0_9PEZI|nr:putative 2-hydroxychromene-2-carboxylate isomerase [Diaporthe ampelina]